MDAPRAAQLVQFRALVVLRSARDIVLLGVLPLVFLSTVLVVAHRDPSFAYEFKGNLYAPAGRILRGESPYEIDKLEAWARRPGPIALAVYPAPAHVMAVPLRLLPSTPAFAVYTAFAFAAVIAGLLFLGVRDWRCLGAAMLLLPLVQGLKLGGVTPLLFFAAASVWRYRDRPWASATALGLGVATKLYLWPLFIWLLATRRTRSALQGLAVAAAALVTGWAVIGFRGFGSYPHVLAILDRGEATLGYSLTSVGTMIGLGSGGARALALVVGTGFLGAVVWTRRDDRLSFAIAALAAVALSPVVWLQYFIFILIPLALAAPRLTSFWLIVPAIYWIAPGEVRSPLHLATAWAAAGLALTAIPWVRLRAGAPEGPTPQALLARRRVRS